ncbi:hypothetical protein, conserved [Leishmania tarentolae]|uniref:ER membrane protein complex subunit 4 n=1 Tax=Leishmania tarentolae TaxID=5689 RepID=A0A640KMD9_LEITA|nr:hypothetical protein, conserved [Leishmania tarentolae]GET90767.1 hypothetical protein, conserved [Leishmania tarentolae]
MRWVAGDDAYRDSAVSMRPCATDLTPSPLLMQLTRVRQRVCAASPPPELHFHDYIDPSSPTPMSSPSSPPCALDLLDRAHDSPRCAHGRPLPPCILSYTQSHNTSGTPRHCSLPPSLFCLLSHLTFGFQAMASAVPNANASAKQMTDKEITRHRVMARLNDIRTQPLKQLPMTVFMMWMVGNEVSIFSIMFVGMAVVNPLQSILGAGKLFADFEEDTKADRQIRSAVNQARWIYMGCCLIAFLVALVKLNWMELLPVSSMDWMDNTPPTYQEFSSGAFYH